MNDKIVLQLREKYHKLAISKSSLLELLSEAEVAEQVFNSNAIENSTLSLDETEKILLQIDLDRVISQRELFEARNLARVVRFINKHARNRELTFEMVLFLHKMLLANIRSEIAGRFRKGNEYVRVASHLAPSPESIQILMEELFATYHGFIGDGIIKRISRFHLGFEHIHPFVDGNGRIGRVLINYLLVHEGYVPINIKFIDRSLYYNAFKEFDRSGKTKIMEEIVAKALSSSYYKRLAYLEGRTIVKLSHYAKKHKLSHSNLLNKAKRQTIEAFLEKGEWKIGETKKNKLYTKNSDS